MNHYERLKVSQDAPAEVIRAAYRALAAKIQPGGPGTLDESAQEDMAQLNTAYEVLIDPKLRQDYDATLLKPERAPAATPSQPAMASAFEFNADPVSPPDTMSTRVDTNWMPPGVVSSAQPLWPPSRKTLLIGGSAVAVIIIATAGVSWQVMGQRQMEKAMSNQYATRPAEAEVEAMTQAAMQGRDPQPDAPRPALSRKPSVQELARLSDEELLAVMPTLDEEAASNLPRAVAAKDKARRSKGQHPLDGRTLRLRTESHLTDPLTTAPAQQDPRRR